MPNPPCQVRGCQRWEAVKPVVANHLPEQWHLGAKADLRRQVTEMVRHSRAPAALDWVAERQCVKTDKDSGIVNDAKHWALETMSNPRYPLGLFLRVITASLATMKVVEGLPGLDA